MQLEMLSALDDLRDHMSQMSLVAAQLSKVERTAEDGYATCRHMSHGAHALCRVLKADKAGSVPAVSEDEISRSRAASPGGGRATPASPTSPESVILRSRSRRASAPPSPANLPATPEAADPVVRLSVLGSIAKTGGAEHSHEVHSSEQ